MEYGVTEVFVKHDYFSSLKIKLVEKVNDKLFLYEDKGDKCVLIKEIFTDKKLYEIKKGFFLYELRNNFFYFYEEGDYSFFRYKYVKHVGSSRSSKSWSLEECAIRNCEENNNLRITVWRDSRESLGNSVWKDFRKIFPLSGRKYKFTRNTVPIFLDNGSVIEPHGDDTTNAHGITQDKAWLNEPYKMSKETFDQIDMRSEQIWIDINPSSRHWSDELDNHPRCKVIHSTFQNNPFCPAGQKLKILSYDPTNSINVANSTADAYMWNVYGLGLKAEKPNRIFKGWKKIADRVFFDLPYQSYYATDFGLSAPTANLEIKFDGDKSFFVHQKIYKPLNQIPHTLSEEFEIKGLIKSKENICDSGNELNQSETRKLRNAGYNIITAIKGQGSVNAGIETIQKCNVYYTETSTDFEEEYDEYSWKIWQGIQMDVPEDRSKDHALDCLRMFVNWYVKTRRLSI
jgi:PBSX family phage terminase large subunit